MLETDETPPPDPPKTPPSSHRKSFMGAMFLIAQPLLMNALSIPATAYIIYKLDAYGYGIWSIGASLVATTSFLTSLGLRPLFVRAVAQNPHTAPEALADQLGLRVLLALLAGLCAVAVCMALNYPPIALACTTIAAFGLILVVVSTTLSDYLQGFQRFKTMAGVNLIGGLVLTALSVLVVGLGWGPIGLAGAYVSGPLLNSLLGALAVSRQGTPVRIAFRPDRQMRLLKQAKTLGAQQVLGSIHERVETLLVPKLVGIAQFGYFQAGSILSDRMFMVPEGLAAAFYPKIAKASDEDIRVATWQVSLLLAASLALCLPLTFLLIALAGPIAHLIFKHNPEVCREVIVITMWALPLTAARLPMNYGLQAYGKYSEAARVNMAATVVSFMGSLILIREFGFIGACWSWVLRPGTAALFMLPLFVGTFPRVFTAFWRARK